MTIDNLRTDLSPQSAVPPKCETTENGCIPEDNRKRLSCEIDERVDTTEPPPGAKPKEIKCIVTSFCPRCGHQLQCQECQGPVSAQCQYCLTNTPKPHIAFGKAVQG